ncbi:MAG: hypothetical protein JST83_04145 [Bacteroidetes bacterium]|nr:hypothetical protein [Bacteroidota bacterium]
MAASCRKATPADGPGLIRSVSIDGDPCGIHYLYDEQGRITSVTQCDTVEQYTYAADSVVYTHAVSGAVAYTWIYRLDASGRASGYRVVVTGGIRTDYTLTYDAAGHRTSLTDITHGDSYTAHTISAGDDVYDTIVSPVSGNYSVSRTFYSGTDNTLSHENLGLNFLGVSSENLTKTESYTAGGTSYTLKYFYELDYLNGVAKRTTKVADSIIEIREYEYYGSGD